MNPIVDFVFGAWVVTIGGHVISDGYKTIGGARLHRWALLTARAKL